MGTQLIYFTAPWCGPCRTFGPLIERLAAEAGVPVVKVNADENADMTDEFRIMSLPTVIVMKDGAEADRVIGANESHLRKVLA